jgi:hypothetical protein
MGRIRLGLAIAVVALLVAVPAAYAGGSTLKTGYAPTAHNIAGTVAKKPAKTGQSGTAPVKTSGTLPFTGLDLGLFAGAAIVLTGIGFGFRRVGRQNN